MWGVPIQLGQSNEVTPITDPVNDVSNNEKEGNPNHWSGEYG
jgi:hypothetical protein